MGASRSSGFTIALDSNTPGSFNQAGYEALSNWDLIGEVTRISGFGPRWNTESHMPLANSGVQKVKTNRDGGSFTVDMALDTDDAGQIAAKAARDSTSAYSVRITAPNGDDYYAQVLVTDFQPNPDSQGSKQTASMVCEVTATDDDVDWVEVLA